MFVIIAVYIKKVNKSRHYDSFYFYTGKCIGKTNQNMKNIITFVLILIKNLRKKKQQYEPGKKIEVIVFFFTNSNIHLVNWEKKNQD